MEILLGKRITAAPIGKLLMEQQFLTQADLDRSLAEQRRNGGRLGQILVMHRIITPMMLAEVIGRHHGKPWVNLLEAPCDTSLLQRADLDDYLRLEALPYARKDGRVQIAATDVSFPVIEWAFSRYGNAFDIVITSPRDILWTIEREFDKVIDIESRYLLSNQFPQRSTMVMFSKLPKIATWVVLFALTTAAFALGGTVIPAIFLFINFLYAVTLVFKFLLFTVGHRRHIWKASEPLPPMRDQDLPVYTLLIPLYKEAQSLPKLLGSLAALDYPRAKLDVKFIIEADDHETLSAAKALKPETSIEIIRVPYSLPRTKPKACNYALRFAKGEYVTIYDAEDQPDALQLKKAVQAFRTLPKDIVCLQARLNYYNRDDNWLTKCFSLEYAMWFDFMLPGLERLGVPIPLGGTSNHISLERLRALGQWDPYNVTEDADLGVRIALSGQRTAVLRSLTLEEAPSKLGSWMRQRTRWIKGYMQTWLVHMRHPREMLHNYGWRGLLGFHLFIGGPCFVFLSVPFMLAVSLMYGLDATTTPLPAWLCELAVGGMIFGYATHLYYAFAVMRVRRWNYLLSYILFFPFYWLLHSWASYRALGQLVTNPFVWEKTEHGISQQMRNSVHLAAEFS